MNNELPVDLLWVTSPALRAGFDPKTGSLMALISGDGDWNVLSRPSLGRLFNLLVPLPGRRLNRVVSEKQLLSSAESSADGRRLALRWDSVQSQHGGSHAISVDVTVEASTLGLLFSLTIDNKSQLPVENVDFPCLGDVRPSTSDGTIETFCYNYAHAQRAQIWPAFENRVGYWGTDVPTWLNNYRADSVGTPSVPYVLLCSGSGGLYIGVAAPSPEFVAWTAELHPGYRDSMFNIAPDTASIGGHEVALRVAAGHLPFLAAGERRALTPILLSSFQGDWHAGVDIYGKLRRTWELPSARPPAWADDPHSWLQLRMNSPEDDLRIRFCELPGLARDCLAHGVGVIQLVGWNDGGQDQNNPDHRPDPRLGTAEEFRDAIQQCRKMGVRIILFVKFTWSDRATERFRNELVCDAIKDPYGDYYVHPGYGYDTLSQLLNVNTKRLVPMCFLSERYLQCCMDEFERVLALEADGILYDESMKHVPAFLCFAHDHGHRPGAPVGAGDPVLAQRLATRAAAVSPGYLLAGEACYDWQLADYQLSYHRSWDPKHIALTRYVHPHVPLMTAVSGFNDRNMVNQCLLYRYIISYEPFNFKGRLTDFPDTVAYGRQMDELRMALREWVWDGTFQDTIGATVTGSDHQLHHPYAVSRHANGKDVALVIANYAQDREVTVRATFDTQGKVPRIYRLVDDAVWRDASGDIVLPPCSAAIVLPKTDGMKIA